MDQDVEEQMRLAEDIYRKAVESGDERAIAEAGRVMIVSGDWGCWPARARSFTLQIVILLTRIAALGAW